MTVKFENVPIVQPVGEDATSLIEVQQWGNRLARQCRRLDVAVDALTARVAAAETNITSVLSRLGDLEDYPWVIAACRFITVPATNTVDIVGPTKNVASVTSTTDRVRVTFTNAAASANYATFANTFVAVSVDFALNPITLTADYAEFVTHEMGTGTTQNPQTTVIAGQIWCIDNGALA